MTCQTIEASHAGVAAGTLPKSNPPDGPPRQDSGLGLEQRAEATENSGRAGLSACPGQPPIEVSQAAKEQFEAMLPEAERRAGFAFRYRRPEAREEAVAQTVAICWQNYASCIRRGQHIWPHKIIWYAIGRVHNRDFITGRSSLDVLGERTRHLGRVRVKSLDYTPEPHSQDKPMSMGELSGALIDRRAWENPREATRIKLDYAAFLASGKLTKRQRVVFEMLAQGYRPADIAKALGISIVTASGYKRPLRKKLISFFGPEIDPQYRREETAA